MAVVLSQAPIAFGSYTSLTGTTEQTIPYNAAGVSAGFSGNLYLDSPPANVINGRIFTVRLAGWIKAHGATQTAKIGLQWVAWANGSRGTSLADTFTLTNASGSLTAGTFYDFVLQQQFFAEANASQVIAFAPSIYWVGGALVTAGTVTAPLAVTFAGSASQPEPGSGLNEVTSNNNPVVSFAASLTNSVSDTTETMQITEFNLES